jgi:UDP-N-acetylmuramoyl-L-alanyl-D-glutamate--2,6-diaminopimelate ligase
MKLSELLNQVSHLGVRGTVDRPVSGIAYDSRKSQADGLFVAIPGAKHDGFEYVEDAVKRGAGVIVSPHTRSPGRDVTHVQVEDARLALADLARVFYGNPSRALKVIGITGTNGKTTTAFMLRDILEAAGLTPGLMGTVQYEIGARILPATRTTPESLDVQAYFDQMRHAGCHSAVMEVSSHALDQNRVRGIDFDVAVFTNLTRDHLDYHQTLDRYYEAKRRLFTGLGRSDKPGFAVINRDDPWGRRLAEEADISARVLTFGFDVGADVRACDLVLGQAGSDFTVRSPWGESRVHTPLLGRFNLQNAMAAYAAARAMGLEETPVLQGLARRTAVPGRLEEVYTAQDWRVFVDYAHTDDALANVLETLRDFTRNRLIVVFGCGGNRDQTKRAPMGAVAARLADLAILTSDNPRDEDPAAILAQVVTGFGDRSNYEVVEDRSKAIEMALAMARKGDIVLIAGKGHEITQEVRGTYLVFDDRQVVRALLKKMEGG